MKEKMKNPLYVVSGNDVEEADGLFDFVIKKLHLAPLVQMLNSIMQLLLEQVNTYPLFKAFKQFVDLLVKKLELFQKVWVL